MSEPDWYEVVQGDGLLQGDLLLNCPIFTVVGDLPSPIADDYKPTVDACYFDLVVMTQSCDLENDKVDEVMTAQVIAWPEAVRLASPQNPFLKSREFRHALIAGNVPSLSLLHKRNEVPTLAWSVVDFHRLFAFPKGFARKVASTAGPRLRLRSPYREHLAQAFARYFMRVGLPHDARSFEQEGKVDA